MTQLQTYHGYKLWRYVPNIPASAVFLGLFSAITTLHAWRMFRTRTWFCVPFTIGGIFEIISYTARTWAHDRTGNIMPQALHNVFILLAPVLFCASIYMTLRRIIRSINGEKLSLVHVEWLTRIFVLGDVFAFFVQGGGAGIQATGNKFKLGQDIIMVGLVIQIISVGLFCVTAVLFEARIRRQPTEASLRTDVPWKQSLWMLYAVLILIMIRSLFRVIEYEMGQNGYLLNHEWTLYIFDSVPMFMTMVVFWYWYPSKLGDTHLCGQEELEEVHSGEAGTK